MKRQVFKKLGFFVIAALFTTGCYTQLQTVHEHRITSVDKTERSGYTSQPQSAERPVQSTADERVVEVADEESYLEGYEDGATDGYEDGWTDAELYYFKDYETAQYYRENQAVLGHQTSRITYVHNYYGHGYPSYAYSGFYSPFYHHSAYGYPVAYHHYPASRFHLSFHFGHSYHSYYRYPYYSGFYYPYGSFFGFGFHRPFFHGGFVHHGGGFVHKSGVNRTRTVRSSGLSSRGTASDRRIRDNSRSANVQDKRTTVVNSRTRSAIRSDVRRTGRTGLTDRRTRISSNGRSATIRTRSSIRSSGSRSNIRSRTPVSTRIRSAVRSSSGKSGVRSTRSRSDNRSSLRKSSRSSSEEVRLKVLQDRHRAAVK